MTPPVSAHAAVRSIRNIRDATGPFTNTNVDAPASAPTPPSNASAAASNARLTLAERARPKNGSADKRCPRSTPMSDQVEDNCWRTSARYRPPAMRRPRTQYEQQWKQAPREEAGARPHRGPVSSTRAPGLWWWHPCDPAPLPSGTNRAPAALILQSHQDGPFRADQPDVELRLRVMTGSCGARVPVPLRRPDPSLRPRARS